MDHESSMDDLKELSISDVLDKYSSNINGLSSNDVVERIAEYGYNEISEAEKSHLKKFFSYFWGPIPWMIEIALLLSLIIQHWQEFSIILLLLLINGAVGFWQEDRADDAIELLKEKLAFNAHVKRDGKWLQIPSKEVVPGDIVKIHLGDIVPADIKLIEGDYVTADESAITGESLPVDKTVGDICYSGSIIQKGQMNGIVFSTGMNTFFGRAAGLVSKAPNKSHLEQAVVKIGNYLIILDAIMVALIFIAGIIRHQGFFDILGFALVLTIASIPVAQPAVLSVTMTVGAMALAKKKAIVSKLAAIEEMAGMDILFSDKTGTLTKNKISIAQISPYNSYTEDDVIFYAGLASLREEQDPLDKAIIETIESSETLSEKLKEFKTLKFNPFDPVRKSTLSEVSSSSGNIIKVSKGAPQVILSLIPENLALKAKVLRHIDVFASKGYRAIGVARTRNGEWDLLGLIALYDPPRKSSKATIKAAKSMGIEVKMVTGDHIAIAKEIAGELDLETNIMLPSSFLNLPDNEAARVIESASGFAEVFPEHKYKIVELLQDKDKIIGMTGDGVNDAPALKKADAGIALSGATDAAKSAADIVLTKPGLSVIINAIKESYKIFHRMKSYSIYRVAETIRILIFTAMVILIFNFYPITALMLVLIALLDDIPVMTIAYDRTETVNSPQKWDMSKVIGLATFLGALGVVSSLILFYIGKVVLNLDTGVIQSLIFLKLVVAGHLTMFVTRNTGHFWSVRPSGIFFWSVILTDIFATLLVVFGWFLTPIGWQLAAFVWIYSLAAFILEDYLKIFYNQYMDNGGIRYFKKILTTNFLVKK
jgi:H+-transporting ATPase